MAHSRLLSLPAELRLEIYAHALAPTGSLYLHTTKSKRHAVSPAIPTSLLQTCRQIHSEAKGILYLENTVTFTIDAHDTTWPTISEKRLPQAVLEKLVHACVLLDCTAPFRAAYSDVDFTPFAALTSLRTLRLRHLRIVITGDGMPEPELLAEILARVPRSASIFYGPEGSDDGIQMYPASKAPQDVTEGRLPMPDIVRDRERRVRMDVRESTAAELEEAMGGCDVKQGSKSGGVGDVWAEYREGYQYSRARAEMRR